MTRDRAATASAAAAAATMPVCTGILRAVGNRRHRGRRSVRRPGQAGPQLHPALVRAREREALDRALAGGRAQLRAPRPGRRAAHRPPRRTPAGSRRSAITPAPSTALDPGTRVARMAAPQAIASSSTSDCASHLDGTITTSAARRWGAASSTAPTNSTRSATPARGGQIAQQRLVLAVAHQAQARTGGAHAGQRLDRQRLALGFRQPADAHQQRLRCPVGDRPVRREPVGVDTVADDDDTIGRPAEHLETDRPIVVRHGDDDVRQRRGRPLERTVGRCQRAADQPRPSVRGEHHPRPAAQPEPGHPAQRARLGRVQVQHVGARGEPAHARQVADVARARRPHHRQRRPARPGTFDPARQRAVRRTGDGDVEAGPLPGVRQLANAHRGAAVGRLADVHDRPPHEAPCRRSGT